MKKIILTLSALFLMSLSMSANTEVQPNKKMQNFNTMKMQNLVDEFEKQAIYVWEVESKYGAAKGYTTSLEKALKMVKYAGEKDVTTYKIVGKLK